jgi:hypothetical protein
MGPHAGRTHCRVRTPGVEAARMAPLDARWIISPVGKLTHGRISNPASLIRSGIPAEYRVRGRGIFVSA